MNRQKAFCKDCRAHWVHGVKDGKHDNWCCKFGKPALQSIGHCKNIDGKEPIPAIDGEK